MISFFFERPVCVLDRLLIQTSTQGYVDTENQDIPSPASSQDKNESKQLEFVKLPFFRIFLVNESSFVRRAGRGHVS